MYQIARSILGDDEASRDAVNDAFAKLMASDTEVAEGDEARFLAVCVRNGCLNTLKHKSVHERFAKMYFTTATVDMRDDSYWKDRADEVMGIVNEQFTERMRRIFNLRFIEGLKYDEIATELGVARMTVYNDLFRGVEIIKRNVRL